jgi:hypothetical protein
MRRPLRRLAGGSGLLLVALLTTAHIGSPDTWFEGQAGPYPVRVVVRLPGVIPGLGQIDITVSGEGIERVTARPVIYDAGTEGAPPPDVAKPVPGRPGTYHAELWFMTPGSFSVNIEVVGTDGTGAVAVPVTAVAERQIALYPWLGQLLAGLGLLLFVGAVTIIRAAATDSVTVPGAPPDRKRRIGGYVAAVLGAGVLALGLYGGRLWWNAVELSYQRNSRARSRSSARKSFWVPETAWVRTTTRFPLRVPLNGAGIMGSNGWRK